MAKGATLNCSLVHAWRCVGLNSNLRHLRVKVTLKKLYGLYTSPGLQMDMVYGSCNLSSNIDLSRFGTVGE